MWHTCLCASIYTSLSSCSSLHRHTDTETVNTLIGWCWFEATVYKHFVNVLPWSFTSKETAERATPSYTRRLLSYPLLETK